MFVADPMTRKEFCGVSRRWQTYFVRVFYVGMMLMVFLVAWNTMARDDILSYSAYTQFGREFFLIFSFGQIALLKLISVFLTVELISREVRAGTLAILAITPLSPWGIVSGKWKSRLALLVMLALSGIPVLTLGIFMGGVREETLLGTASLSLAAVIEYSALGILCSSLARTSVAGIVLAVFVDLACWCVLGLVSGLVATLSGNVGVASWIIPSSCMADLLSGAGSRVSPFAWIFASAVSMGMAIPYLWLASLRVRRLTRTARRPVRVKRPAGGLFEGSSFGGGISGASVPWSGTRIPSFGENCATGSGRG